MLRKYNIQKIIHWLLVGTLLCPIYAHALGVGGIKLNSTLNQQLDAEVELLGIKPDELEGIDIQLASPDVYERMGIDRNPKLDGLRFRVKEHEDGGYYIHISTRPSLAEPFLNFLIEVNWNKGRLLREFTVLLDPPLIDEKPPAVAAPESDLPPSFTVTTDQESDTDSTLTSPITESEESVSERLLAEIEEITKNEVESGGVADRSTESDITTEIASHTVREAEYLWRIADEMRPSGISIEQMMLALKQQNPDAFFGDNVSMLKAGAVLRVDDSSSLDAISDSDAKIEIAKQNQAWLAYRKERQARNAVAVESANQVPKGSDLSDQPAEVDIATNESTGTKLRLETPIDGAQAERESQTNAVLEAAQEDLAQLNIELVLSRETIEAGRRENEELISRISSLQEQMASMQSIIQLKNAELQKLQSGVSPDQSGKNVEPLVSMDANNGDAKITQADVNKARAITENSKDTLFDDVVTIAASIISVMLLLSIFWILRSKSGKKETVNTFEVEQPLEQDIEKLFPEDDKATRESSTPVIKFNESKPEENAVEKKEEELKDITFENSEVFMSNENLLDPIAEADVYLTYEKYDKAESLLKDAINATPTRTDLKLKLLEVYTLSNNLIEFDKQAENVFEAIGGDVNHQYWKHAKLMAKNIESISPLFVETEDDSQLSNIEAPSTNEKIENFDTKPIEELDEPTAVEKALLENNKNTDSLKVKESGQDKPIPESIITEFSPESIDELENLESKDDREESLPDVKINQDLINTKTEEDSVEHFEAVIENTLDDEIQDQTSLPEDANLLGQKDKTGDYGKDDTVVEFDSSQSAEIDTSSTEELIENQNTEIDEVSNTNPEEDNSSLFLLSDEVGTKLDLAKAYMEMGDHDGAYDLLNEVVDEGTESQKKEAQDLMETTLS